MSEENTKETERSKSFEERVFLRFDAIDEYLTTLDSRVLGLDSRVSQLEVRQFDTRPIWDSLVAAMTETTEHLNGIETRLNGVDKKLDNLGTEFDHGLRRIARRQELLNQSILEFKGDQSYL